MRRLSLPVALVAALATSPAAAGDLYGNLRDERGAGIVGALVQITVSGRTFTATTGRDGFYRLEVQPTGSGQLQVARDGGETNAIRVYSFPDSVRWNLRIEGDRLRRE